ncbi:MAG: type II secretion system F family protein [Candidatus Harrisonbacteria bacterium]|nr:type II secretion system F family protein [Candidatus Harrisonbacteria bacterium]MBI2406632.1 type II secretion system F family protein [Candidatus Harrisonbacteria bacterium]
MRFHYTASTKEGKTVEGDYEANATADVLMYLGSKELKPLTVERADASATTVTAKKFFGQPITIADQIFLTRYLGLMLRAGVDLFRVIDILTADFDKPAVKAFLLEMKDGLEKGQPFYLAFAKYPEYFSPVFTNLVKAGERSGNLDVVFDNLSVSLEREQSLRNRIKAAVIYPVILLVLATAILFFLVTFALPKIANVFLNTGVQPPAFSRIVFTVGLFLADHIVVILVALVALIAALWVFFARTQTGGRAVRAGFAHVPVVRTVYHKVALQQFASTLSALMKSGLPILESLNVTADVVSHPGVMQALRRIASEGVAKGMGLGESFRREPAFPLVISNLIAVSEKAGHTSEILETLAKFYDSEIDASLKTLVSLVEPLMLLFIGGIVGLIALSIIIPIYQLVGQF